MAYADGRRKLDEVEDELFRLDRVVAAERALSDKLSDRNIPLAARQELLAGLLQGKADAVTVRLAERAVDGRGRSFAASMRTYQVAAAARRNASIATVRVATDLTEAERARLADGARTAVRPGHPAERHRRPERGRRRPGGHRRRSDRRNHRGQARRGATAHRGLNAP